MWTLLITSVVAFVATAAAVYFLTMAVGDLFRRRRTELEKRLGISDDSRDSAGSLSRPEGPQGRIDRAFVRLVEESGTPFDPGTALMFLLGMGLIGGMAAFVFTDDLLAAAAGMLGGVLVPLMYWCVKRWIRVATMRRQLPETLHMLADAVRSGRDLQQAAELVAHEMKGPLGQQFAYCAHQLRLGQSPVTVLNHMAVRIPQPEFRIFATAVTVHRRTGGNLAKLTDRLASAARDRQEFYGHLAAVTAGSRLSAIGMVVGSIVGVGVLLWIEPNYLALFLKHQLGPTLLAAAGVLELIGFVWCWRILRISY